MGRVRRFFAAWGLDVLVVIAAAASAVGTVLRNDSDRPDGLQLWFEVVAIAIILVPSIVVGEAFPSPVVGDAIPRAVIQALLNAITTPMSTAVIAALYLELRARKSMLDQRALQANLAARDLARRGETRSGGDRPALAPGSPTDDGESSQGTTLR